MYKEKRKLNIERKKYTHIDMTFNIYKQCKNKNLIKNNSDKFGDKQ